MKAIAKPVDRSVAIATLVSIAATVLFAVTAMHLLPAIIDGDPQSFEEVRPLAAPLILCIALIILSWRRAADLQRTEEIQATARRNEFALSYTDDITGLRNRRFLNEVSADALRQSPVSVLLMDLDGFKKVNDLYGHATGDELLKRIAERITAVCPAGAQAFRLGGDEFAICLTDDESEIDCVSRLAARLVETINQPVSIDQVVARVGVSLGIATREEDGASLNSILHRADIAMYEAKRLGKNRYVWFDVQMERKLLDRNKLEAEIRTGIERGEFVPHFQPLLDLQTSTVKGFEVLARWNHPDRGMVQPDDFIPLAETSGLISDLSNSVMRSAIAHALRWPAEITIAVNISPIQFKDPLLADRILAMLREQGFPPTRLELEITESAILMDKALALATVNRLKAAGVRISLDDFGTGYASLSQLKELPFDRIKIDRSFIASLLVDKQNGAIVEAIATLGRSLALPITAEGVEEEVIQKHLIDLGCTDAQGWLFGKALEGSEAARQYLGIDYDEIIPDSASSIQRPTADRRNYGRRGA